MDDNTEGLRGAAPERETVSRPPPPSPAPGGYVGVFARSCLVAGCATIFAPFAMIAAVAVIAAIVSDSGPDATADVWSGFYGAGGSDGLRRVTLREGREGAGDVAVVRLHGGISGDGSPLDGEGLMADVSEQLRAAAKDAAVKAVLLQVDSPGGGLTASDLLHHEVEKLVQGGKPVVVWAGGVMASGGYYVAAAAGGVMASPTATVGSIGVILNHVEASEAVRKLGIRVDPIVSGDHKDIGSPFREMTPDERRLLQDYVDASHRRFVEVVSKGRKLPPERVARLANGDIFTAEDALRHGLIDRIGYVEEALDWLEELSGVRGLRVVGYRRPFSLERMFRNAGRETARSFWDNSPLRARPAAE